MFHPGMFINAVSGYFPAGGAFSRIMRTNPQRRASSRLNLQFSRQADAKNEAANSIQIRRFV